MHGKYKHQLIEVRFEFMVFWLSALSCRLLGLSTFLVQQYWCPIPSEMQNILQNPVHMKTLPGTKPSDQLVPCLSSVPHFVPKFLTFGVSSLFVSDVNNFHQ